MNVIGINGFKRSGKGTVGSMVEHHLENVKCVGFADKLKCLMALTMGLGGDEHALVNTMDVAKERWITQSWDCSERTSGEGSILLPARHLSTLTYRSMLQNMGNDARNLFGDTFWIDQVLPRPVPFKPEVDAHNLRYLHGNDVKTLCVTDVRYENEARRVLDLGGVVWRVNRPGLASDGHASEKPLPDSLVTWDIHNDKGLETLNDRVLEAIHETIR